MGPKITERTQTYFQSNAGPEPKLVALMIWRGREGRRGDWEKERLGLIDWE
jgi:hypothetical protein